ARSGARAGSGRGLHAGLPSDGGGAGGGGEGGRERQDRSGRAGVGGHAVPLEVVPVVIVTAEHDGSRRSRHSDRPARGETCRTSPDRKSTRLNSSHVKNSSAGL